MSSSTAFQEEVYKITRQIPKGKVSTYGKIAELLGNPKAARAVGNALHNNPDPFYTPCYRVVSSQGKLAEHFGLGGKEVQKEMLEKDGIEVIDFTVDLKKYGI